jgi:hypothetical protein
MSGEGKSSAEDKAASEQKVEQLLKEQADINYDNPPAGRASTDASGESPKPTAFSKDAPSPSKFWHGGTSSQLAPMADRPGALDGTFSADSPDEQLRGMSRQLGMLRRWMLQNAVQKLTKDHAIEIAKQIFRYQYMDIQQKLMLGLDVEKKRTYLEYLKANKEIQARVQGEGADAVGLVAEQLLDTRQNILTRWNTRVRNLNLKLQKQDLTDAQHQEELSVVEAVHRKEFEVAMQTAERLIDNHGKLIETTLSLFKDKLIKEDLV